MNLEHWTKTAFARGVFPYTIPWVWGKVKFMTDMAKQQGKRVKFDCSKEGGFIPWFRLISAVILYRTGMLTDTMVTISEWLHFLPKKLRPKWYFEMDGHKIFMNDGDPSMMSILKDYIATKKSWGTWEPETTKLVKEKVKPGDICLDVGASIGYFTMLFSRQVGKTGKVFSFEPTTNQIPYIKENIRKNGYSDIAKVFNVGAWDKTDQVQLPLCAALKYDSKCVAIDDVLEAEGIKEVNFIKIDVDGPEPKVLKGLTRTIERSPNLKMVIEFYPKYILDAGCDPKEFQDFIDKYFIHTTIPGDYEGNCWNLFCTKK